MLVRKIRKLYPSLDRREFHYSDGSIHVQDDGAGPYIAKWEHPTLARPTQEQLDAIIIDPNAPETPEVISQRQLRQYLRNIGRYAAMKSYIANADEQTQIYFEYETVFLRAAPEIAALAANFNLTSEEMDNVFIAAALL